MSEKDARDKFGSSLSVKHVLESCRYDYKPFCPIPTKELKVAMFIDTEGYLK